MQRGVHVVEVQVTHAIVGAEPIAQCGPLARGRQPAGLCRVVGPVTLGTDAVLVPALHGAADAGPFVVLAPPLVVTFRHLIQHARADEGRRSRAVRPVVEQEVRDGRQAEAGTGTLKPLIEDAGHSRPVIDLKGELRERGLVVHVPEVKRVLLDIERSGLEPAGRHATPRFRRTHPGTGGRAMIPDASDDDEAWARYGR